MTIAEIHGKISGAGTNLTDRMEDLLTSDVFTACKYVQPQTLLIPFLSCSKSMDGKYFSELLKELVVKADYQFWPRLTLSEPDVIISILLKSGKYILVLIEAKYFSSVSDGKIDDNDLEIASTPTKQLAREYADLLECPNHIGINPALVQEYVLVYTTAHRIMPIDVLLDSYEENFKFYWLSWFELHPLIQKAAPSDWEKPILEDLELLIKRKRLTRYSGYKLITVNILPVNSIYNSDFTYLITDYNFNIEELENIGLIYEGGK